MEVRLQSEVRPPPTAGAVWSVLGLMLLALGLLIYSASEWYFPKSRSVWLAVPPVLVGLYLARAINRAGRLDPRLAARSRSGAWLTYLFVPGVLGAGVAMGGPALVLRLQGPDQQVVARVESKTRGSRSCRQKIVLAGHRQLTGDRLCIDRPLYDRLEPRLKVVLATRENAFGLLAFSIQRADAGPE
jgi:hypothetical protein